MKACFRPTLTHVQTFTSKQTQAAQLVVGAPQKPACLAWEVLRPHVERSPHPEETRSPELVSQRASCKPFVDPGLFGLKSEAPPQREKGKVRVTFSYPLLQNILANSYVSNTINSTNENPLLVSIMLNKSHTSANQNPLGNFVELTSKASGVDPSPEIKEDGSGNHQECGLSE